MEVCFLAKIEGISHITFIVKDLKKSAYLFKELFGAEEIYDSQEKNYSLSREKFFLINDLWLALMEGESLDQQTYNHLAFKIQAKDYEFYLDKIAELGLEIKSGRSRVEGEAQSLYFYDYDNHLFEFHTGSRAERLEKYKNLA